MILPLILLLLLAVPARADITLSWTWISEIQEDGFEMQRAPSGCTQWEIIALLPRDVMSMEDPIDVPGNCYRVRAFDASKFYPYSAVKIVPDGQPVPGSCGAPSVNAFTGCYYDELNFANLKLSRVDQTINFDWGNGSPHSTIGADTFSATWEGDFNFAAGTHRFNATTDDGFRLYIDGQRIIDAWFVQPATPYSSEIALAEGTHRVRAEFFENAGLAVAKLSWNLVSPPPPPTGDTTPPTVEITNPADGSRVARNSTVTIRSTFSDNVGVVNVRYFINGVRLSGCGTLSTSCAWAVPGQRNKLYNIRVDARDQAGNVGTAKISVRSSR